MVNTRISLVFTVLVSTLYADNFILKNEDCIGHRSVDTTKSSSENNQNLEPQKIIVEDVVPNSDFGKAISNIIKNTQIKPILFDFDKHDIRSDMTEVAQGNTDSIKQDEKVKNIVLEGNADERGSDEYNYGLALKRANSVKDYYVKVGIDSDKISTISLGEGSPVCEEHTEDCWAKNRRVDTKIGE
jgi:peptidoglycan-associated lipoprotein